MLDYYKRRAAYYERVYQKPERQADLRGSVHEVLKNFPTPDEAFAALGPRAREPRWTAYEHYWVLDYTLA